MAKKVLRYTEEEFVTLLENIVNKVKSEEKRINESKSKKKVLINEDFESDVREAVIEDWDDRVITKLILDAKNEGSISKLVTIKSYLQELLQTDPDAELATFFSIDIDKFIQEIRNQRMSESKSRNDRRKNLNERFKSLK